MTGMLQRQLRQPTPYESLLGRLTVRQTPMTGQGNKHCNTLMLDEYIALTSEASFKNPLSLEVFNRYFASDQDLLVVRSMRCQDGCCRPEWLVHRIGGSVFYLQRYYSAQVNTCLADPAAVLSQLQAMSEDAMLGYLNTHFAKATVRSQHNLSQAKRTLCDLPHFRGQADKALLQCATITLPKGDPGDVHAEVRELP